MPTVLVTGANRGLGLEFARQYAADGWTVIATARRPEEAADLNALGIRVEALDVEDLAAVTGFGEKLYGARLDLLIANAGTWGPERMETASNAEAWLKTLRINSVAPFMLAKSVLPNVAAAQGKLFAVTSKMGSIEDNTSGGYVAYRSSKAALNAAWKSLAIDVQRDGVVAAVIHPGWVQTRMGGPSAPLTPPESVAGMRRTIAGLAASSSGGFFNYDGTAIPW